MKDVTSYINAKSPFTINKKHFLISPEKMLHLLNIYNDEGWPIKKYLKVVPISPKTTRYSMFRQESLGSVEDAPEFREPGRVCNVCGVKMSMYNLDDTFCFACQKKNRPMKAINDLPKPVDLSDVNSKEYIQKRLAEWRAKKAA